MNTRLLTIRHTRRVFTIVFFWLPVFFFSALLVINTLPYFSLDKGFSFIQERAVLFLQPVYNACFYLHIFAGMCCIAAALLQFSSWILRKRKKIHVWSGRVYVFAVLAVGAPTGLYMSFFAKGGLAEKGLFMFMALSWFVFTMKGLTSVLRGNVLAHKIWMMRSYAMALTAVSFRIYYIILYLWDVPLLLNYEVSLWVSVAGNLVLVEYLIYRKSKGYLNTFIK